VVVAAVLDSPVLLFATLFVYGAGSATNLQARYAGADLAEADHRARAISRVLVATTVGGVVGPLLAGPTGHLAHMVGVPHLAGPFILASASYVAAAAVLATRLRPDPLLHAREVAADEAAAAAAMPAAVRPADPARVSHGILVGAVVMVLTQAVMVAIMTMTPVHMRAHGHGLGEVGLVIGIHVGAMYLPSLLTGALVDRVGRVPMAVAAGVTLLLAGVTAAWAPGDSLTLLIVALTLLGLGWNLGLIAGTALLIDGTVSENRAKVQGAVDVLIALGGAGGGALSGVVVAGAGFPVLALAGGLLAMLLVPALFRLRTVPGRG